MGTAGIAGIGCNAVTLGGKLTTKLPMGTAGDRRHRLVGCGNVSTTNHPGMGTAGIVGIGWFYNKMKGWNLL
jgi:hypothetical protein